METDIYNKLHAEGIISDTSLEKVRLKQQNQLFSVHWELKTLLYLGVMLLSGGLGILVYKNIDTIGHQVILLFIALLSAGCFAYCIKHKQPFSRGKVTSPSSAYDYVLLLGAISMVTFIGYLQFKYNVFGTHYGMATLIPMLALFYIAYNFDHLGILSIAIVNLALWMGLTVTPRGLLAYGTFNSNNIIYTAVVLGLMLLLAGHLSQRLNFKKHFKFTYQHYGLHVAFIALLAGYFYFYESTSILWLIALFGLAGYIYADAYRDKSFYFILLTILYSYFALCCIIVRVVFSGLNDGDAVYLLLFSFIASAFGLIYLLIYINKKLKAA